MVILVVLFLKKILKSEPLDLKFNNPDKDKHHACLTRTSTRSVFTFCDIRMAMDVYSPIFAFRSFVCFWKTRRACPFIAVGSANLIVCNQLPVQVRRSNNRKRTSMMAVFQRQGEDLHSLFFHYLLEVFNTCTLFKLPKKNFLSIYFHNIWNTWNIQKVILDMDIRYYYLIIGYLIN